MLNRNKIFYPAGQITEGLYTQGKEWMLEDDTEYIGLYHKYSDGIVMTEARYDRNKSKNLFPYKDIKKRPTNLIYDKITKLKDIKKKLTPKNIRIIPSLDDYKKGYIVRYLIRKRNDTSAPIYEVDEKQFNDLGSKIDDSLFFGIQLKWKISGPTNDIKGSSGQIKEYGIVETNKRTLINKEREMSGVSGFLGDLLEFSVYSKLTSEKIKQQIFVKPL